MISDPSPPTTRTTPPVLYSAVLDPNPDDIIDAYNFEQQLSSLLRSLTGITIGRSDTVGRAVLHVTQSDSLTLFSINLDYVVLTYTPILYWTTGIGTQHVSQDNLQTLWPVLEYVKAYFNTSNRAGQLRYNRLNYSNNSDVQ